jgi:prepilin-type N-terminal cleavage/methylation domain-containing protein
MKRAFSLIELLVAIVVFSIAGLPIFSLYFRTGIGQQKMIRDFLSVTTVVEKVINRVNQEIDLQQFSIARFDFDKDISNSILKGDSVERSLEFLDMSFKDKSGEAAFRYIPESTTRLKSVSFKISESAVPSSHRSNNPQLLKEVLLSINDRSRQFEVNTQWRDAAKQMHGFDIVLIKSVSPES